LTPEVVGATRGQEAQKPDPTVPGGHFSRDGRFFAIRTADLLSRPIF
jgi:hypothetical protein